MAAPADCLEWTAASRGKIPADAVSFDDFGRKAHFCRAADPATGKVHTGVIYDDEQTCNIHMGGREVAPAPEDEYEVLAGREWGWRYPYRVKTVDGAVPCSDPDVPAGSCFLGHSFYGDGICSEGVGKVDVSDRMMTVFRRGGRVSRCPFYTLLVDKSNNI